MAARPFTLFGRFDPLRRPAGGGVEWRGLAVGLACVGAAAVARVALEQVFPGLVPFLLTFPVVILGTLIAGAGAGWVALAGCQVLTLLFVLPHWMRDSGERPEGIVNLALATLSLALAVWATSSYRRSASQLRARCEREVETLSLFIAELDHRTKNNFQIAASLLYGQGLASPEPRVTDELNLAANRLASMASIYQSLSSRQPGSGDLPLRGHLEQVCAAVRASMLPPDVAVAVGGDELDVPSATALTIGLIVNEWLTNAAKYAFPARRGSIAVRLARVPGGVAVAVEDDGVGLGEVPRTGLGSRLMTSLVEALNGTAEIRSDRGTHCRLTVPLPAR